MIPTRRAILVTDLAYGDCGKGTIVDFLTRRFGAQTVVRFNGGPQAGHNVVTPDGRHHTFSQFTSGTFVPGVNTLLSRYMLIEPYSLLREAKHLEQFAVNDAMSRLFIDRRCPVITPCHEAANHVRERARGRDAHGTCGRGVGELMQDLLDHSETMIRAEDLGERATVRRRLEKILELKRDQLRDVIEPMKREHLGRICVTPLIDDSWIEVAVDMCAAVASAATLVDEQDVVSLMNVPGTILFEGAQGVLLDESLGFQPHTTWSNTTFDNAQKLLEESGFEGDQRRVGVLRSYFTRHGKGPFVTEDQSLRPMLPEPHNEDIGWQGKFRVGGFDAVAARYAIAAAGGVDALAITHLDRLSDLPPRMCIAYRDGSERMTDIPIRRPADLEFQRSLTDLLARCCPEYQSLSDNQPQTFLETLERELHVSVGVTSDGLTANSKRLARPNLFASAAGRGSV